MKVKLKDTVGMYQRPGKLWEVYYPGDIFEVPTSQFFPEIMEKIEEPKKEEPTKVSIPTEEFVGGGVPPSAMEPEVTVTTEEPAPEPTVEEPPAETISEEPKKTRRRKRS